MRKSMLILWGRTVKICGRVSFWKAMAVLTVEIDTQFEGLPYMARYWAFSHEDVFGSVFAAYGVEHVDELNAMAVHFFPENASCELTEE